MIRSALRDRKVYLSRAVPELEVPVDERVVLGGRDDAHDDASLVVGEYSGEAVALPVSVDDWEPSPPLPP